MKHNGTAIRIRGRVQGVGFRPFVWQLAGELGRTGDVSNDAEGVLVHLVGDEAGFIARLRERCPPLARIDDVVADPWQWQTLPEGFSILPSGAGSMSTQIVPDAATCPACL
ncbi:acylphosphatase, partial [Pluralibacter gergoviae]